MREKIYKDNIKKFYVDEKYNFKGTFIGDFYHGVCIDFSLLLKEKFNEIGLESFLISTITEQGNHGALIYIDNNEIFVVDPITDARIMTNSNMSMLDREKFIENNKLSFNIPIENYIKDNGLISIYDDNLNILLKSENISDIKKIISTDEQKNIKKI